jgi:hypothetical protein
MFPWLWESWHPPKQGEVGRRPLAEIKTLWRESTLDQPAEGINDDLWVSVSEAFAMMGLPKPKQD